MKTESRRLTHRAIYMANQIATHQSKVGEVKTQQQAIEQALEEKMIQLGLTPPPKN